MWGVFLPMLLVYTICTAMSMNCVRIFSMITIIVLLVMVVLGKPQKSDFWNLFLVEAECSAAVAGQTVLGVAGVPGAGITMPTSSTTMRVFESSRLPRWFLAFVPRALPLFSFPLFSFFLCSPVAIATSPPKLSLPKSRLLRIILWSSKLNQPLRGIFP